MADRQGIEIDYCPQCRGVWLDRGELDKLIERSAVATAAAPAPAPAAPMAAAPREREYRREPEHYRDSRDSSYDQHRRHKKKGFLGELFDFD
jgi:Zn-finger nucleic acid-binding protein